VEKNCRPTGKALNVAEALRLGLVNRVVARGELLNEVNRLAEKRACAPRVVAIQKHLLDAGAESALTACWRKRVSSMRDRQEGTVGAFHKTPPQERGARG
jgi:enoyl-CoA hydratase/carnithine racemase